MIPQAFTAALNHLLGQHAWARERLAAHAGSHLCLRTRPLLPDIHLSITAAGLLAPDQGEGNPDLLVSLKPAAIPMVLSRHPDAMKNVELAGNAGLASIVQELFERLDWDAEEDLSRVFGDVAAHRMASSGREFLAWQREALERTAQNAAEYWTEESPLLARRADFDKFRLDVQSLDQHLARIQARLDALVRATAESAE